MDGHDIQFLDELADATERLARVRILYTDLDGTLLGAGACLLRDGAGASTLDGASAVESVEAAKLPVMIVSGRNVKQLMEVSRLLGFEDFIAELGTIRRYRHGSRKVYDTGVWPEGTLEPAETPFEAIARMGALKSLQRHFPGLIEYHDPWHLDREVTHVLRGNVPIEQAQTLLDALPLPVTLLDNGIIHPPATTLRHVTEVHAYHLVPTGTSKQAAIAADLAERGLSPDQAVAIGDSATDLAMSESVGLMVVVNNGLDDAGLVATARRLPPGRVAATRGRHGAGWRELADAWIAARGA